MKGSANAAKILARREYCCRFCGLDGTESFEQATNGGRGMREVWPSSRYAIAVPSNCVIADGEVGIA